MHPILFDDIHYIDWQPFKVAKAIKFDFCFKKIKDWFDTHDLYMIILQNAIYNCNEFIFGNKDVDMWRYDQSSSAVKMQT